METDYASYIEQQWASDGSQSVYIDNIQKQYEIGFWQKFDTVQPKQWNPKEAPNIVRRGFIAEEMPPEVWGDSADGKTLDSMKLIAYQTLVLQALKSDIIISLNEQLSLLKLLRPILGTDTVTEQEATLNRRLEVLGSN